MDQAELTQLTKLVKYLDEERRKDRALIAQLQERVQALSQELEARSRQAQSYETALSEIRTQLIKALGWTSATEQLRNEFAQMIARIEEQRAKAEREALRNRQVEIETLTRQLGEIKRELKTYARYAEELESRRAEGARLNDAINQVQAQVLEISRQIELPTSRIAYLEEQRRQDAKRIAAVEQELPNLKRLIETFPPQLLMLDEAVRRRQVELEEAAKIIETQSQLIENQRVADVRRERQFAEYAELIEKLKQRAEEVAQQVTGYIQMREEVKRELARLPDLKAQLEARIHEVFELQRDAEERMRRAMEAFRAQAEKDWKAFVVEQEEKWHDRDRRIAAQAERLDLIEEELPVFQPQINALYDILEAFSRAYANAGREWMAEANQLFERARTAIPSEVKPSRRQRRKQRAQAQPAPANAESDVDLNADLVQ
ncbi:MAG: hypothetical protein NZ693_11065 [Thermoflexales bacterium]|nr:hypothetical protein [Thermoflexales bacterium]